MASRYIASLPQVPPQEDIQKLTMKSWVLYGNYESLIGQLKNGSLMIVCAMHHTVNDYVNTNTDYVR
jgi:hypothetical protein